MGLLDWLYGIDAERERGERLNAAHMELNRLKLERGQITPQEYQEREARLYDEMNYSGQVEESFWQGWSEGYEDLTGGITRTINAPVRFLWDSIPWWVWLAVAALVAQKLGLFNLLKK